MEIQGRHAMPGSVQELTNTLLTAIDSEGNVSFTCINAPVL